MYYICTVHFLVHALAAHIRVYVRTAENFAGEKEEKN